MGFVGFVESFENCVTKRIREMNLLKIASRNESAKQIFWKWLDSWPTIQNESRIRGHNTVRIHGFAKRIHVFTNLLYDSRILSSKPILLNHYAIIEYHWKFIELRYFVLLTQFIYLSNWPKHFNSLPINHWRNVSDRKQFFWLSRVKR